MSWMKVSTLAATLHLSGRAVLGSLYPDHYLQLLDHCYSENLPLDTVEESVFPVAHTQVLTRLLKQWSIPAEVYAPLAASMKSYSALAKLPEPLRTRTELLKIAASVGALANGRWHCWDLVDFPPPNVLHRLGIHNFTNVVECTERDACAIANFRQRRPTAKSSLPGRFNRSKNSHVLQYINLSCHQYDVVQRLLESVKELRIEDGEDIESISSATVLNCLEISQQNMRWLRNMPKSVKPTIICNATEAESFDEIGEPTVLPCGFGQFRSACLRKAQMRAVNSHQQT